MQDTNSPADSKVTQQSLIDIEEQIKNEKEKLSKEFEEKVGNMKFEHEKHKREKEELIQSKNIL